MLINDLVNWEEQWELFAENYHDGKAHIDLSRFGKKKTLLLLPGPGFGDLSHPTTSLMLRMLQPYADAAKIIDIGTGSGILSLAALLLGAQSAIGIDIDLAALAHARKNNRLNHLNARFAKRLPKSLGHSNILLMNMILSEQRMIDIPKLNPVAKLWIVSGILASQKDIYLQQAASWDWQPISEYQEGDWMGWIFTTGSLYRPERPRIPC